MFACIATPELRLAKKRSDKYCPIWIRIRFDGQTRFHSLAISVKEVDWSKNKLAVKDTHPNHAYINSIIQQECQRASQFYLEKLRNHEPCSVTTIKNFLRTGVSTGTFNDYADRHLVQLKRSNRHTYNNHRSALNKFIAFGKKEHGAALPFSAITPWFLSNFDASMHERKNSASTRSVHLGIIRSLIERAKIEGYCRKDFDPFHGFRYPEVQTKIASTLTPEELRTFRTTNLSSDKLAELARDLFVFSYYTWGMRFSDIIMLEGSNLTGRTLSYVTSKTNLERIFPLKDIPFDIVRKYLKGTSDYIFPPMRRIPLTGQRNVEARRMYANSRINKGLRRATERANIDKHITFHCARHTITSHAMSQGMSLFTIQHFLGHSSPTTTADYTRQWRPLDLSDDMNSLYDQIEG